MRDTPFPIGAKLFSLQTHCSLMFNSFVLVLHQDPPHGSLWQSTFLNSHQSGYIEGQGFIPGTWRDYASCSYHQTTGPAYQDLPAANIYPWAKWPFTHITYFKHEYPSTVQVFNKDFIILPLSQTISAFLDRVKALSSKCFCRAGFSLKIKHSQQKNRWSTHLQTSNSVMALISINSKIQYPLVLRCIFKRSHFCMECNWITDWFEKPY